MKKERTVIDQELCRKVQIMLSGAKGTEVAQLLGISETTVSRIKAAGFDAVQYNENTDRRRITDKNKKADAAIAEAIEKCRKQDGGIPGQIRMEMPAEEKEEYSEQTKMMRFQAGQVSLLLTKLDRINDTLNQILRRMGSENG